MSFSGFNKGKMKIGMNLGQIKLTNPSEKSAAEVETQPGKVEHDSTN